MSAEVESLAGRPAPKSIVLFSDGTGNSSAKLFKTNVWKLYEAIDIAPASGGAHRQIVFYDDGVGTSAFKPLALLGGAFGVGLMRNVLDLYRFLCMNYEPGDHIYAFGFSRGAFTIRVLVGLVTEAGVIRAQNRHVLDLLSADAYRAFRRCFRLGGNRKEMAPANGFAETLNRRLDTTDIIVTPLRWLRDVFIRAKRRMFGLPAWPPAEPNRSIPVDAIRFVGVWDTVAAYGSPMAELTKAIDRWIWPLSMPDYKLSQQVKCARHALALDDERDTFHPLLWDEVHEKTLIAKGHVTEDRLRQVWFAGMHSDVGGGYPNDSLSHVSLAWMAQEAMQAGLRLKPAAVSGFHAVANPHGPIHNSRSGLAAYYRYQPRKIAARLRKPDPTTLLQQDPDLKGRGLLEDVRIHDSVLERIERSTDDYAPIVLPPHYLVEGGPQREVHLKERATAQERVWDYAWRRRVNYFATLLLTLALVLPPLFRQPEETSCEGLPCLLSPVIRVAGSVLPGFASRWIEAYASSPGIFLLLLVPIVLLMKRATRLEVALRDSMRHLFGLSLNPHPDGARDLTTIAHDKTWIRRLRSSAAYQRTLQVVKWRLGPGAAAILVYGAFLVIAHRIHLIVAERSDMYCRGADATIFSTDDMCWRIPGAEAQAGKKYRLRLVADQWKDGGIETSPEGFSSNRLSPWLRIPGVLVRRSMFDPWFQPLIHVRASAFAAHSFVPVTMRRSDVQPNTYIGEFSAPASGPLTLSVNDAVFLWAGSTQFFYTGKQGRNTGQASSVTVTSCEDPALTPACEK